MPSTGRRSCLLPAIGVKLPEIDDRVESRQDLVIVGDGHHRGSGLLDVGDEDIENVLLVCRIEIARRFIAQQQRRLGQQGPADRDALPLSLRKTANVAVKLVANAHFLRQQCGPLAHRAVQSSTRH